MYCLLFFGMKNSQIQEEADTVYPNSYLLLRFTLSLYIKTK